MVVNAPYPCKNECQESFPLTPIVLCTESPFVTHEALTRTNQVGNPNTLVRQLQELGLRAIPCLNE